MKKLDIAIAAALFASFAAGLVMLNVTDDPRWAIACAAMIALTFMWDRRMNHERRG
jgi:hypothetical protein